MSTSMAPWSLSLGDMRLRLQAHMMTSPAEAGGGGGEGGGRGRGGNPHLSVDFRLITPAEDHTTQSEHLYFNPPFSCIMEHHGWHQEVNSMIASVVARVRSANHNFLVSAFCNYSKAAANRFLLLSRHRALFLYAEIEMADSPPRHSLHAAVETPWWLENLETVRFQGNEQEECGICLMDFVAADELDVMPCYHRFHSACLRKWLRRRRTCPMCRFSLSAPDSTN